MQFSKLFFTFFVALSIGCTQDAPAIIANSPNTDNGSIPLSILDLPYGKSHSQFDGAKSQESPIGSVTMNVPLVSDPLSEVFFDYVTQIDISEQRIIGSTAKRTFISREDCMNQFSKIESAVRAKFKIDSESGTNTDRLVLKSGTLSIETSCSFDSGSAYPTLMLMIYDKDLAKSAFQKSPAASGR